MAGLSKQHFEKIAEILNNLYNNTTPDSIYKSCVKDVTEDLSNYFKTQNPLFNENRFKKACLE